MGGDGQASADTNRTDRGRRDHAAPPRCHHQEGLLPSEYRGTSLIRKSAPLGPYSRSIPRALWWSWGGGGGLLSEVPLHGACMRVKARFWPWLSRKSPYKCSSRSLVARKWSPSRKNQTLWFRMRVSVWVPRWFPYES